MVLYDLPIERLRSFAPQLDEPDDLDTFWSATLDDARQHDLAATFLPVRNSLAVIESFDVRFAGFAGQMVHGWLHLPVNRSAPLPCVVQYLGYGDGRGLPHEHILWAVAGYANLVMDTRGQGSGWASGGVTRDPHSGEPAQPGFLTRGILDPTTYYYRRLFTDAVRAVEAARAHEAVDAARITVAGGSQGGGMALAVSALIRDLSAVMVDVPFLCHVRRATQLTDADPYGEIRRYLAVHRDRVDSVFRTLSYFDGTILARRANASALFSVALMDLVCPPSTVYAAYNAYAGPKEIREYEFNGHEGGGTHHQSEQLGWLAKTHAGGRRPG